MADSAERGPQQTRTRSDGIRSALEVWRVTTRLGLTSFGGPIAHLGYFHQEYVVRRRWIDEQSYADLVALCQFLPGPASSEVGMAVGITRAGLLGGLAAWLGFTLPSAIALVIFAYAIRSVDVARAGWLHGLMVVAVAVVARAVWSMARTLAPDRPRATIAVLAAIVALIWTTPGSQVALIALGGVIGWRFLPAPATPVATAPPQAPTTELRVPIGRRYAVAAWIIFFGLLVGLPLLRHLTASQSVAVADSFYRSGALVFGGGHVVLPLLQREVVPPGWVTNGQFLAGYGAAQAVPGPLFTFAAYLGAVLHPAPHGWAGAALATLAIFAPSFFLVSGALPFWAALRRHAGVRAALQGVNAVVVGLLLAALYQPVWISTIKVPTDAALALAAFGLLAIWNLPPWVVVLAAAAGGAAIAAIS